MLKLASAPTLLHHHHLPLIYQKKEKLRKRKWTQNQSVLHSPQLLAHLLLVVQTRLQPLSLVLPHPPHLLL
ncbi:hypothetical protein XENORESO_015852 [Xenotaenia resolanae]|uniref:Uncharacterized protein n=1 Tax=Xenotaenia resolanae TaxID=208358 RepID=A0ABV0X8U4_9TELE